MKKSILFLLFFAALASVAVGQNPNDWFITVWNPEETTISFNATGNGYTLKCVQLDGSGNEIPATMQTFTGVNGSYTITTGITAGQLYRIYAYGGTFNKVDFYNSNTLKVEQWGTTVWSSFYKAFRDCSMLDVTATDIPNLSICQNLSGMFSGCTSLVNANGSISGWQTANVTDMSSMFYGATAFNQPLNWNTQNVTNMGNMFTRATAFNSALNFNTQSVTNMASMFYEATSFNQPLNWNTQNVTNMGNMFTRATAFNSALNWNTQSVTDMSNMFYGATSFNQQLNWNTQSVTDMSNMFYGATSFNQQLNWNTQSVTNMAGMFSGATSFNQPLNWNTQIVTDMQYMFSRATAFNSALNFNTQSVTNMASMFFRATSFNQQLNWNTQSVTDMSNMFSGATSFNQQLNWNTQSVTNMAGMFYGATSFNQPLNWNTQIVTNMNSMFYGATSFNQQLNWNTQSVITMERMFSGATAFNQPLNSWNTAKVIYMRNMFSNATDFNQPLNSWNTAKVTDMAGMFSGAMSFDQPLDSFKINDITTMTNMLQGSGMSCQNLSVTLDSWKTQAAALTKNNINLGTLSANLYYNQTGQAAINTLKNNHSWTITGGSFAPNCILPDYFVTEWDMAKPARDSRPDAATSLRTNLLGTNFVVEYINLANPADKGKIPNANGSAGVGYMLTGLTAGAKYRIIAYPNPDIAGSVLTELQSELSDQERLIKVTQWGTNEWTLLSGAFQRCVNMDVTATDIPHYVGGISLNSMFAECSSLVYNTSINNWNLSDVTDLGRMFRGAVKFNQPIGNWNTGSVSNMAGMFQEATSFNQSIDNWSTGNVTDMSYMFYNATAFDQPLNSWRTENVTDMKGMFYGASVFNQQLNNWNTAKVTDMNNMFNKAYKFNKDISSWNTAKVTDMSSMFRDARDFNKDISNWDTRNVTNMSYMFDDARAFNQPLNSWNTAKVTNMSGMFAGASVFNQPLNNWDVSKVTRMAGMFTYTRDFNQDISSWNTESVTDMAEMFYEAFAFNQPLNSWNTAEVTDMKSMFFRAYKFNQPLSNWNTAKVTRMSDMFSQAYKFNQDISSWNTAEVTDMSSMFEQDSVFNQDISGWNTAKVTDMNSMFYEAFAFNKPLNSWNTANVTDMSGMFEEATSFNQPLSNWNTEKVTDMRRMFLKATSFNKPIGSFRINAVTVVAAMLYRCGMSCQNLSSTLDGWATQATALGKNNVNLGDISTVPNAYNETGQAAINTLKNNHNWTITGGQLAPGCILPAYYVSEWDLSKPVWTARPDAATTLVTNLVGGEFTLIWENLNNPSDNGFVTIASGTPTNPCKIPGLTAGAKYRVVAFSPNPAGLTGLCAEKADYQRLTKVTHWGTTQWTSLTKAFSGCGNMDITATDKPDLSAVTDLSMMFQSCGSLVYNTSINDWDVSHVTNMSGMFATATEFNQPLNNWDVSHVTNMQGMFAEALKFNQPLNNWVVSSVTNMSGTFVAAMKFNQNINSWNVSNVTDMSNMFGNADDFNQPLNNWVTSKVTNMSGMFSMASKFNQDINSWDVSKVTNMSGMFDGAKVFNKPLNNWDVSNVTDMNSMFRYTDLFNQDITGWDVSAVTNMQSMFERALVFNQDIKGWNTRNVTDMRSMFKQAAAFDRDLGSLRIDALTNGTEMFASSGMSCDNYSKTLKGWAESSNTPSNVNFITQTGIAYGRHGKQYRHKLTSLKNWTISGDNFDLACSIGLITPEVFVTEWDLSQEVTTARPDAATTLFTNFLGTNFVVEYINLADPTDKGIELNANGVPYSPFKLTGLRANAKYRLIAYANPNVPGSVFNILNATNSDAQRLSKVTQWGTNEWQELLKAFYYCLNMDVTATDIPIFTGSISLKFMFYGCPSLVYNPSINNWHTAGVTNMSGMFLGDSLFNHPLDSFKIDAVTNMEGMLQGCGMSCENLSVTLDSWKTQATALNKNNINLGTLNADQYYNQTGQAAITALQTRGWTITGGTYAADCLTPKSWFVTVWDITKPTNRTNHNPASTISFGVSGGNYKIYWEDVNNPLIHDTLTVPFSSFINRFYLTVPAGTTKVRIKAYKGRGLNSLRNMYGDDPERLIAVEQWGTAQWSSFEYAFHLCKNMDVTATDRPNLTACTSLGGMFHKCTSLVNANGSISSWNTENITTMIGMFSGATSFNQPLNWNTENVTDMAEMFEGATSFNQPLNWNTEKVTTMQSMFAEATSFNQPLNFNTQNVTRLGSMFSKATSFNQPLDFNTQNVIYMSFMFSGATSFNQPINWNIPNVISMEFMFSGATSFNRPFGSTFTSSMSNTQDMGRMFQGATSFDQSLNDFKIDAVYSMYNMLKGSGISCENLSTTLDSWATQATTLGKNNINLDDITTVPNMYNEMGRDAITALQARNWYISGGRFAPDCVSPDYYVSVWDMSKPATTGTATNLVTNLWGSSFRVEWKNLDDGTTGAAIATTTTAPYTITGLTAGKRYRVVAYADPSNPSSTFSKLATMKGGGYTTITDAQRLDSVTQWGTNRWTSLDSAFFHCSRMDVTATDVPDLRGVKDLSYMFYHCDSLIYNPTINTWRTDSITNMRDMFGESPKFNQPLGSWNTAKVTDMHGMFEGAHNFDQNIHNWNTGKVTDMSQMFLRAFKFNQPIGSWNTANVTNMAYMFAFATSFNKSLYWNVEKVTDMTSMFWGADAFDQDLSYWTLKSVTSAGDMFKAALNKGMSCGNYSETLQGWAINPLTKTGLNFGGQDNRQYNIIGKESRDMLMKPVANGGKGWTISGDTYDKNCGIDYVWTGAVSTNIADNGNWQGGQHPGSSPILGEFRATVAFDSLAVRDMHIPSLPYTPPGSTPNYIHFYSFGNLINNSNKKVVIEPNGHLHINKWVFGSSTPADVDKIVIKADDTNPNGSLILAGQPCDKPVYATVEMYSKAGREATAMTWTDNIPSSPTKDSLFSVHYRWQYIGIPVEGEYANAFYGSYLRKYDETYNDPNHYYGKWRKLGANETWQPLVPFAGYEVTSRTPKVYVFKGRLLHCPQELTLTRQAAEVSAVPSSFNDPRERRWELGHNVFGNSYTSALMIGQGKLFADLEAKYPLGQEPIEGTVYVYNTGSIADWAGGTTLGSGPGQYVAVPVFSATALSEQYISSMQGFMLKFKEDTLRINGVGSPVKFRIGLNKEEHYLSNIYPFGGNQRPQRAPQAAPSDKIHGYLKVGLTSRRSVSSISLIEAEGTTDEFDNGWDGMQLNTGRSSSATLFVPSEYGDLQVSTSDNIVGDRFGIVNNGDTAYRLTVIRHRLDNRGDLYLYDVATNRYTLLDADTTVYDFTSEGSGNVDKRFVITDRRNADDPNTAVEEAAEDMSLYGYIEGRNTLVVNNHTAEAGMLTLLDVSGKAVYTSPFGVGFSRHDLSHLPAGVYIARLEASVRRATVKAITMK